MSEEKFCGNCGAKLKGTAKFCGKCGEKIKEEKFKLNINIPPKITEFILKWKFPIIAVIVVIVFILLLGSLNSPDKTMKKLCNIYAKGEYGKIYDIVNLPKSKYITSTKIKEAKDKMYETINFSFDKCEYKMYKHNKKSYAYNLDLVFRYEGETESQTTQVEVVKSGKFLLLFNKYKIKESNMSTVIDSWNIKVPKGSTLYVEGKKIKNTVDEDYSEFDIYEIKNVLTYATYDVKVENPLYETYEEKIDPSYSSELSYEMTLKESVKTETTDFLKEALNNIYKVALERSEKDGIKKYFGDKIDIEEFTKNRLKDISYYSSDSYVYKDISTRDFNVSDIKVVGSNELIITASFKVDYSYKYNSDSEDWYESYRSMYSMKIKVIKDKDSWKISSME